MAKRIAHFYLPHPLEKQDGTVNPAIQQWHLSLDETECCILPLRSVAQQDVTELPQGMALSAEFMRASL